MNEAFDSIESYENSKRNNDENNNIKIEKFINSFKFDVEGTDAGDMQILCYI